MTAPGRTRQFQLDELDHAILKALPAFGAKHGKYLDAGLTVAELPGAVDNELPASLLGGRLRTLTFQGYARQVKGLSKGTAKYQRSEKGDEAVKPKLKQVADA